MIFRILRMLDNASKPKPKKLAPKPAKELFVQCKLRQKNKEDSEAINTTTMWLPDKYAKLGISMTFDDVSGIWIVSEVYDENKISKEEFDLLNKRNHNLSGKHGSD